MAFQARLKSQYVNHYPGLNGVTWYEVEPLWAGLKERNTNLLGQRLARLKTASGHLTVIADHCELREARHSTTATTAE